MEHTYQKEFRGSLYILKVLQNYGCMEINKKR